MELIHVSQDRLQWMIVMITVINLSILTVEDSLIIRGHAQKIVYLSQSGSARHAMIYFFFYLLNRARLGQNSMSIKTIFTKPTINFFDLIYYLRT
jgi:hypothetical protein